MNFNICRHLRLAGSVAVMVGFALTNWTIVLLGNLVIIVGYMMSIGKIEQFIEKGTDCKIETEDK